MAVEIAELAKSRRFMQSNTFCAFKAGSPGRFQMTNTTTTSTHDQVEGKVHEVKGAVKEKIGQMTNNPNLQDEGTAEKFNGTVERKVGEVKKVFGS